MRDCRAGRKIELASFQDPGPIFGAGCVLLIFLAVRMVVNMFVLSARENNPQKTLKISILLPIF